MGPPIFRQLELPDAQAAAASEGRLLVVEVTAEHCGPCMHMDRTTWVHPEVIAWVEENAVAIQVDRYKSPFGKSFAVKGYPTVIVFRGAQELDRKAGAWGAAPLLHWLDGVKSGRTELEELRAKPKDDLTSQIRLASALLQKDLDDEALEVVTWLWEHSAAINATWRATQSSRLISLAAPLLGRSERARERFKRFRDEAGNEDNRDAFMAFMELNHALGENERTLAWLGSATRDQAVRFQIRSSRQILEVAEAGGALATLGRLIDDGIEGAEEYRQSVEGRALPSELTEEELSRVRTNTRRFSASFARRLGQALRAAERAAEAARLEAWADEVITQQS